MTYYAGDPIRHTVTFETNAGVATDPGSVVFTFLAPDLIATTYTYGIGGDVVKSSTGVYYCDHPTGVRDVGVWNRNVSAPTRCRKPTPNDGL